VVIVDEVFFVKAEKTMEGDSRDLKVSGSSLKNSFTLFWLLYCYIMLDVSVLSLCSSLDHSCLYHC